MDADTITLDKAKMEQVILFFLERINNVHLGRTKLMKLLYYVDFDHFEAHGESVTGAKYRKLPHGPVADKADKVIAAMERTGLVQSVRGISGKYAQDRLVTLKGQFDVARFTPAAIVTLEAVAHRWEHATSTQIERASHDETPWASTEDGQAIDYELAEYRKPIGEEAADDILAQSPRVLNFLASLA